LTHCYIYCNRYDFCTLGTFSGFFFLILFHLVSYCFFSNEQDDQPRESLHMGRHFVYDYIYSQAIVKLGKIDDACGCYGTEL
jgi:hypothetical protein